ncbi:dephospho-CoA kinase [candidate division KSB1 bacterium]|nr:dephospho-CoA kinase [candidate division KSB1 bacterium]
MTSAKLIVGVTGGAGSGKTTFVHMLQKLGADILDVDDLARQLVESRMDIQAAIRQQFGDTYFDSTGALRRRELGRLVFSDPAHLQKLNAIVWPPLLDQLKNEIQSWQSRTKQGILIVDMAILFEINAQSFFDQTILIAAPETIRIERLRTTRQWSDDEIQHRMQSQQSDEEKGAYADMIIQNFGSLDNLEQQAKSQFDTWIKSNLN